MSVEIAIHNTISAEWPASLAVIACSRISQQSCNAKLAVSHYTVVDTQYHRKYSLLLSRKIMTQPPDSSPFQY